MPSSNSPLNEIPEWKKYLQLGEKLLDQPSIDLQCHLIVETVQNILGASARVWLSEPYFPLPGENEYSVLPNVQTDPLVEKAFNQQLLLFSKDETRTEIQTDNRKKPHHIAIPLVSQDNMLGVLEVSRNDSHPFDTSEINFLEGLAAHAAVSMQIIRQVTIKNWRLDQLALVRTVSEQIANVLDLQKLSAQITKLIQESFGYYYVAIFLVNGKKRALELKADAGATESAQLPCEFSVQMGEGIIGHVARNGTALIVPNVKKDTVYKEISQLPETASEAAFPLKLDKKIIGVLDVQSDQPDSFHETDTMVLTALANSIAIAVQDADLYSNLQNRADQIATIFEISHAVNSILELDELLDKIIQTIKKRFDFDYIHLFTVHHGRRKVFYQSGTAQESKQLIETQFSYDLDDPEGIIPWVARTGISAMTNNAVQDNRFTPDHLPPFDSQSELVVPLQYGSEVLGILDVQSKAPDAFDENDLFLFEALAATISTALRNAFLYRSEQWRHQVAESFRNVIGMISANTAIDQLLHNILVQLNRNLPCDASAIWLLEKNEDDPNEIDHNSLRLAASWSIEPQKLRDVFNVDPEIWSIMENALKSPTPIIRRADNARGPLGVALNFPNDYSSIAAPLRIGDQTLGLLTLAHKTARRYGSEARTMTMTFANYAAVAIQNARLYSDSQEQAWISTILLQVAQTCQASDNSDDLFESIARLTPLLVGVRKCAFLTWDAHEEQLVLKSEYGFEVAPAKIWPQETPAVFQLVHTRTPVFVQDAAEELFLEHQLVSEKTGTLVLLPLIVRGELLGAFLVAHERSGTEGFQGRFSRQTLAILQGIAQQTAITLDNMRLIEARQEEAYITAVLLQVAQAVVSQNKLEDIFDTIVNLLPILIGVNSCVIYLPAKNYPGSYLPAGVYSDNKKQEDVLRKQSVPAFHDLLDFVNQNKQMGYAYLSNPDLTLVDESTMLPYPFVEGNKIEIRDNMLFAFPISIKDNLLGILMTKEERISKQYIDKRIELLTGVSQEIALAIQNHNLQQEMVVREKLEQEIQLARQIQKTFLPDSLPQLPGWEIETRWETALQVGGDFYDVIELPEQKIGLVIADVSDKGIPAALYMTVSRTLIRAFGQTLNDPAGILHAVNNLLVQDTPGGMFVTAVVAILDLKTGQLIYANAGHNLPVLLQTKTKKAIELPRGGMALGVLENNEYRNETFAIDPDEVILFYTDGLSESFSADEEVFGVERIIEVLKTSAGDSITDIFHSFEIKLDEFRNGHPPTDDLTMIALKRLSDN